MPMAQAKGNSRPARILRGAERCLLMGAILYSVFITWEALFTFGGWTLMAVMQSNSRREILRTAVHSFHSIASGWFLARGGPGALDFGKFRWTAANPRKSPTCRSLPGPSFRMES